MKKLPFLDWRQWSVAAAGMEEGEEGKPGAKEGPPLVHVSIMYILS